MNWDRILYSMGVVWLLSVGYRVAQSTDLYFIDVFANTVLAISALIGILVVFAVVWVYMLKYSFEAIRILAMRGYGWKVSEGEVPPPVWRGKIAFIASYMKNFKFVDPRMRRPEKIREILQIPEERRERYESE